MAKKFRGATQSILTKLLTDLIMGIRVTIKNYIKETMWIMTFGGQCKKLV